ncbi:MAG TPA: hopanoid-associated sugar epimerase [Blastocatellia bacterium]|nr:hopanoid-associated sugar epimerase [Blastocatellia bacterium]
MKVFITGSTGFIGANLTRSLLARGFEVKALIRPGADSRNVEGLQIERSEADLADRKSLAQAMKGCQAVFHVAALYSLWKRDAQALYQTNVEGSKNIFDAAADAEIDRVVYTSSVAAIGVPAAGTVADEATQTSVERLVSEYKKSKFLAEQEAIKRAASGQNIVIVNPSTPIGPYDIKPTPTGEIVLRFLNKQMPAYVDTGLNVVDVEDVAQGHILALERGCKGERYILGNRNLSFKELLEVLSKVTGMPAPAVRVPHFIPLIAAYMDEGVLSRFGKRPTVSIYSVKMSRKVMFYDSSKAVRELGLPQSPIEGALEKAVQWFRGMGYVKGYRKGHGKGYVKN